MFRRKFARFFFFSFAARLHLSCGERTGISFARLVVVSYHSVLSFKIGVRSSIDYLSTIFSLFLSLSLSLSFFLSLSYIHSFSFTLFLSLSCFIFFSLFFLVIFLAFSAPVQLVQKLRQLFTRYPPFSPPNCFSPSQNSPPTFLDRA
ncbi:unnamed protein product [Xylocopa violacea]|uniref:Transmembrane protein n=1 Tax=Xylocopa violacea TaxID=135666 RepID=A0ABP1NZH5_XYLVO